jgi:hypothetical protein
MLLHEVDHSHRFGNRPLVVLQDGYGPFEKSVVIRAEAAFEYVCRHSHAKPQLTQFGVDRLAHLRLSVSLANGIHNHRSEKAQ